MTSASDLKQIVEAALLAAGEPLSLDALQALFLKEEQPEKRALLEVIEAFRINIRAGYAPWVSRLWQERPARYSRALLETLALIAYRQPVTRGEIEEIRGVSVSTHIMKTLLEREWVRVVGQRDVPGRPSLYATTREFLDYFGLKGLDQLPTLQEIRDLDSINRELDLELPGLETSPQTGESARQEGEVSMAATVSGAGDKQDQGLAEPLSVVQAESEPERPDGDVDDQEHEQHG